MLADKKKVVSDADIEALVRGIQTQVPEAFKLERFTINSGSSITATSTVRLSLREGGFAEKVAVGDGPIDASFNAIDKIVGRKLVLEDFDLSSVTEGKDALGEARVKISHEGRHYNGHGLSTDVIEASVRAYLTAINVMVMETGGGSDANRST